MAAIYCRRHRDCCTSFGTCQKPQSLSAAKEVPARRHQGCDAFVVFSGSSVEVQWKFSGVPFMEWTRRFWVQESAKNNWHFLSPLEASLWGRFHSASDSLPHLVALDAAQAIRLVVSAASFHASTSPFVDFNALNWIYLTDRQTLMLEEFMERYRHNLEFEHVIILWFSHMLVWLSSKTPWPKAEFPAILPPAKVLSALAPLGECWELRYLRRGFENGTWFTWCFGDLGEPWPSCS